MENELYEPIVDKNKCPYCFGGEMETIKTFLNEHDLSVVMECPECKRTWTEIYKLVK